jgi:hypothetical protein
MTIDEVDALEKLLAEFDRRIEQLIEERWKLVNPTFEEVDKAHDVLTDDWFNSIGLVDIDNSIGRWLIPDEVLLHRRYQLEDEQLATDKPTGE